MHKSALLLVIFALLFTGCTIQVTTFPPGPSVPTSSPVDRLATQVSWQPTQTPLVILQPTGSLPTGTSGLSYFWPALVLPEMKFNSARSSYGDGGYIIEFTNSLGTDTVLRAGTEADRYPYCEGQTSSHQIRGVEGCSSMGTGAGASVEWKENGIHYSVGGIGNSLEAVVQFAGSLETLDLQSWQQKFIEAAGSTPTRIEFDPGETSTTLEGRLVTSADSNTYLLQGRAGQTMTVTASSVNNSVCLTIVVRMTDGSYIPLVNSNSHPTTTWSDILPTGAEYSQEYSISVSSCPDKTTTDTPYTLFVNVVE